MASSVAAASQGESLASVLRQLRTTRVRSSEVVVRLGQDALARCRLGDEAWTVREQMLVAALDVDELELASACEKAILEKFSDSGARARRLKGLGFEAAGDFDKASETYASMLEANAANGAALKRQVCVLKGRRDVQGATEKLVEYVSKFQSDRSGWQELAETYTTSGLFAQAVFCYEELIMFEPMATHYYCRLGELHYTIGTAASNSKKFDILLKARKYFAHCLQLFGESGGDDHNSRPAFGLLKTCSAIGALKPDDALNVALGAHAAAYLKTLYKTKANKDIVNTSIAPFVAAHTPPYR